MRGWCKRGGIEAERERVYGGVRVVKRTCEKRKRRGDTRESSDLYESPSFG